MNEFNAMNNVYGVFYHEPYPARVAIEVPRLPKNVKVEIEVIASK
jgi:2-iminobutanoate/2-iminopropanoate deaminase